MNSKLLTSLIFILMNLVIQPGYGQQKNLKIKSINPDTLVKRLGDAYLKYPESVGLSIGLYHKGKNYVYNFGSLERGKTILPSENTLYEIGSITKTFFSFLLAKAVLEKKVRMDDDIRKYLEGNYPNLEFNGKPIQLIHLANTTAGIPDWLPLTPEEIKSAPADSAAYLRMKIYSKYTRKDFFDALHQVKLDTAPGYVVFHSNAGAQLLAYILEVIYKTPYPELISHYILNPEQMNGTSFAATRSKSYLLAKGYDIKGNLMPYFTAVGLSGAGGLLSNITDMLKYIRLQFDAKNKIVKFTHSKFVKKDVYYIGLNWLIYDYDDGFSQIWTDGGTNGFCSYIILYPEIDVGIILLSNENDEKSYQKLSGLANDIFDAYKQ